MLPLASARRTLPVIDTTFVVKLEESKSAEPDQSYQAEAEPLPVTTIIPIESVPMTTVTPMDSMPTPEAENTPSYSQPKPPPRLYFSPTLLLDDDDEAEPIQAVLSTVDQNQTSKRRVSLASSSPPPHHLVNIKPKMAPRRFGQTFLLDNVKTEEVDESQDAENIRPEISDEIPFLFHADPTLLMEKPSADESHPDQLDVVELQ